MIELKNQYVCKLDIGDFKDFLNTTDLIELLYVEDSAMRIPTLEAQFILRDVSILDYLNEGSVLTVGIGKDELSVLDLRFRVSVKQAIKKQGVGYVVSIIGLLDLYDFTKKSESRKFENLSTLQIVENVSKQYFQQFKTNIEKTNDIHNWQQSTTSWDFLKSACMSGYIDDSTFLISGFDSDTFYYYDYKKKLMDSTLDDVVILSKSALGSNVLNYNKEIIKANPSGTASAIGNNSTAIEYNWLDYTIKVYKDNLVSLNSLDTTKIPISDKIHTFSYRHLKSENKASLNFAKTQNAKNAILNSNVAIYVSTAGNFKKLKLFDVVLFDTTADKRIIGYSMVSRIAYQITNSQLMTNISLVRESFNGTKGELQNA